MALQDVISLAQIKELSNGKKLAVLHFWASWCEPCKQMDAILLQLAKEHPDVAFLRVEAEVVDEASMQHNISSVPSCILLRGDVEVSRVEGADPPALLAALNQALGGSTAPAAAPHTGTSTQAAVGGDDAAGSVEGRIKFLLAQHPILLFMKGSVDAPRCGFSGRVVKCLQELQAPITGVDILEDEPLRQGLKQWSNWPTYPQLYVKGDLVGGCDIVEAMHASGELKQLLVTQLGPAYMTTSSSAAAATTTQAAAAAAAPPAPVVAQADSSAALQSRLQQLVQQQAVMLFMKGTPAEPRCGFSRKVAAALQSIGVTYGSFDILQDEAVRQGLKEYSNWPTYPQLYVKGELLGGCDIVLQMQEAGELQSTISDMLAA